jgi:glycosyltransferase involved in cell wall biosynthesis
VSYDIDGAREVVLPCETGFLLPPESIDPLVDALAQLAGDAQLCERFGHAGRERFTEQFRHEHMTQRIRELYVRLLDAP